MDRHPCVYIMASRKRGDLYVGTTSNLPGRMYTHREGLVDSYTRRKNIHLLVWYEMHENMPEAIRREKSIKHWRRTWKIEAIEKMNPAWDDLYETLF